MPYLILGCEPIDILPTKTRWVGGIHRGLDGVLEHHNEAEDSFMDVRRGASVGPNRFPPKTEDPTSDVVLDLGINCVNNRSWVIDPIMLTPQCWIPSTSDDL